ncbi:MAG TPA: TonB-dependent receptor [Flavitalea sp.]|nr:TonB-dependent receptor [Flavitalea sp.]
MRSNIVNTVNGCFIIITRIIIMRKINIAGFIVLTAVSSASAQTDTTISLLDEVTITSTRKAIKGIHVPYSTQSVSGVYLENHQSRTTPEALIGLNGVFIQKTNHGGGSPFIRGMTGNQTLILVDGIRLNNSTFRYGPNQYLNTIDPFTIRQIEVAKGTGSVQYGSDAIGGVLQIFTKEPAFSSGKAGWSGKVAGKYVTGDMEKTTRAEATYSGQKVATSLGATYRDFGDLIGGDTTGHQSPSGYNEFAFDQKTRILLKSNIEFILANQFVRQQHVPVYHKVVLENFAINEFDPQQRMMHYAKLNIANNHQWIQKIEIIASWQQSIEGRSSQKNGSNTFRKERDKVNTLGFTTDVSSRFSEFWSANSGIELYLDKVNSVTHDMDIQSAAKKTLRGLYPDDSKYGNYSLYSLHHFDFKKWLIEAGVRYNFFSIMINDTTLGKVKVNPSSFVYNTSVLYKLSKEQSLYLTFNTGYRAPNIDDMGTLGIVDFRYEVPASDLEPEKSRNIELGYKLRSNKLTAGVSGYYMHLSNLITRIKVEGQVINGYAVYKKENVEKGYIKGIETELEYQILSSLRLKGNIAYIYGQSLTRGEPLRRIPPFNGRLMSIYNNKKWFASAELLFASKQSRLAQGDKDDNRIPKGGTPGWRVLNLYAGYELAPFRFNLAFQNLFNEDYRTHGSGINGIGRSASFSAIILL